MHDARQYSKNNGLQREGALNILNEFKTIFNWRCNGTDSLLDIGCGVGNVTIDYVLPTMPPKSKLIGVDVSEPLVQFARKKYSSYKNVEFRIVDMELEIPKYMHEKFNLVTSFYCLHWVKNQQNCFKNIYNLLTDDGVMLLYFVTVNPIYNIYRKMIKTSIWAEYINENSIYAYKSPYQKCGDLQNCEIVLESLLLDAGFQNILHIESRVSTYEFQNKSTMLGKLIFFYTFLSINSIFKNNLIILTS